MNALKICVISFLMAVLFLPTASQTSFSADKVIWNVGWIFYGRDLAWFNALEGGFWKAEGLDVKIVRGFGGSKAATDTAAGKNTIGGIDTASLVLGRAKGLPLKMVFIQHDIPPFVVRTLEGNGVNSLKDLEGKKFGTPAGDASWANFPMLAKINGFDIKKMNVINVAPAVREQGLLGGQYAACTGFITQTPIVRRLAAKQGKKEKILLLANYGLDMYGYGYAVTDKTAATQGPVLKRLLRGTMKGLVDAMKNPDKALDALIKHAPTAARQPNREVWDITLDLWVTPEAKQLGLGWSSEGKWKKTLDIITKNNNITKKIPVNSIYSNAFLPKMMPPKRAPRAIERLW